jgi:hypothetical protein
LQITSFLEKVFAADRADDTLTKMLSYALTKYLGSPVPKPDVIPSFERFVITPPDLLWKYADSNHRKDVQFSIMQGGTKAHSLDEAKFVASTVGDMFERLMQTGHLTEKDGKNKTISLQIDL